MLSEICKEIFLCKIERVSTEVRAPDTNGIVNYDISSLGLDSKPAHVSLTLESANVCCRYDWDNSTKDTLKLFFFDTNGNPVTWLIRFGITIFN